MEHLKKKKKKKLPDCIVISDTCWTKAALKRQAPLNKRTKMLKMELSRDSLEQIFVLHKFEQTGH